LFLQTFTLPTVPLWRLTVGGRLTSSTVTVTARVKDCAKLSWAVKEKVVVLLVESFPRVKSGIHRKVPEPLPAAALKEAPVMVREALIVRRMMLSSVSGSVTTTLSSRG
jgi:hypothetical protein